MKTIPVDSSNPLLRLLGRMDLAQRPLCLDWTGSGVEFRLRGSDAWVELEATAASPIFYVIVLVDGSPVCRFPVEPGVRFYPLLLGMEPEQEKTITLLKETQCMPEFPAATLQLRSLRYEGELLPLAPYDYRIEFIGDSLTSGEGSLAPRDNQEWVSAWFSARGNYSWIACEKVNAERRVLSQSGYGAVWNYQHEAAQNMTEGYELIAGVLHGPEAEARGCRKEYDFASWPADLVCIRLLTNDVSGLLLENQPERDRPLLVEGCLKLIRKVREHNPQAKILWIKPGTDRQPEIAEEAAARARKEGIQEVYTFALPDWGPEDLGARNHPNAAWNQKAGELLGDYLQTLLKKE